MDKQFGLMVSIFRCVEYEHPINKFDRLHHVIVIDPRTPGAYSITKDTPGVKILTKTSKGIDYVYAEPLEPGHYAFGGSFIYTNDGRFDELSRYPIPLHDRQMDLETH